MEMKMQNLRRGRNINSNPNKQRGFGTQDMLIAVAIFAIVIGAIYGVMATIQNSNKAVVQGKATSQLVTAIQGLYDQDFTSLSTTNVNTGNLAPKPFTKPTATTLQHAWGGAVVIGPGNQAGATPITQFKITFTGVPKDTCLDFLRQLGGTAYSLWAGGTTAGTHDVVAAGTNSFDQAKAITQCSSFTATSNIIMVIQ